MSGGLARALRVLAPNDLRLIWRDGFLLLVIVMLPIAGWLFRWLIPWLTEAVAPWVDLEPYHSVILGFFLVGQMPILLGAVIGILFVEERDEGTLLAIQASPLSLRSFLGYRMWAGVGLNVVLTPLAVALTGLVAIGPFELLAVAALASLAVPIVALAYSVFIANKVQAVTAMKPVQAWGSMPALLYFAPTPWEWIGSIVAPLYYPIRLFWTAAAGAAEWWLVLPGLLLQGALIHWLLRRFRRILVA